MKKLKAMIEDNLLINNHFFTWYNLQTSFVRLVIYAFVFYNIFWMSAWFSARFL